MLVQHVLQGREGIGLDHPGAGEYGLQGLAERSAKERMIVRDDDGFDGVHDAESRANRGYDQSPIAGPPPRGAC